METEAKKRVLRKYIFIAFLLLITAIVILLMIKYNVEGEKNMPFKLSKIVVQSTIDTKSREGTGNLWDLELTQNNDIYIYIENTKNNPKTPHSKTKKSTNISITPNKQ